MQRAGAKPELRDRDGTIDFRLSCMGCIVTFPERFRRTKIFDAHESRPLPAETNGRAAMIRGSVRNAASSGGDCLGVLLVDAHFVVVSLPAIAAGPEERELHRSALIAVDGDISEFNSDSSWG